MLRSMRRNTKTIMLVVAAAFVGLMVFQWGMNVSGRSNPLAVGEVGRVNGTGISYQVWTRTFRNLSDQARQRKGSALNDMEIDRVEEQAWSQLVNQILIDQELKRRGITVTDEEVKLAFRTSPPPWLRDNELFQTDGQFDFDKYRQFFSGPAVDPNLLLQIEQYYRDVLPRARLMEQIASGIYVSDSELWDLYRVRAERVRVRYIVLDPETQVEDAEVSVSEEDLRRYYRSHRDDFVQPVTATVSLVEFSRVPGPADSAAALETSRRIRADIIEGADFAEQARQHSTDRASAASGGDLGWFERGDMTPQFERAAFALKPGELSQPVLTPFGYHIIKLTEKDGERVRASHILIPIHLGGARENELLGEVDRVERIALRSGLEAAADSVGVERRQISLAKGTDFVPGIGRFGPVHDWAFHDSTLVGDLSPVYETDDGFYVFELIDRQPESVLPFEDAEPAIRRRVLLQKKKETARWLADRIADELRQGSSLDEAPSAHGLSMQTTNLFTRLDFVAGLGQSNSVIGAAFALGPHEIGGPIEADGRFYFVEVIERVEASREAFESSKEDMRAQLTLQRREAALDEWLAGLREKARIDDWRQKIFVPRS